MWEINALRFIVWNEHFKWVLLFAGVELERPYASQGIPLWHGPHLDLSTTCRHRGLEIHERSANQPTDSAHAQSLAEKIYKMWKPTLLLAAALAVPAQALHFFIDGAVQKCFFEELPKDTLVVGTTPQHLCL